MKRAILLVLLSLACVPTRVCARGSVIRVIPPPASIGALAPFLAPMPDGQVLLSWVEKRAAGGAVRCAVWNGRAWSAPRTVVESERLLVNWADVPSMCVLQNGTWVAHWGETRPGSAYASDVKLAFSRDAGATWSAPVTPYADTAAAERGFASLVPLDRGGRGVAVAWLDGRAMKPPAESAGEPEGDMQLRLNAVEEDGSLLEEMLLDERVCDCCPTAAVPARDTWVLVYRDRSESEVRDIAISGVLQGPLHNDGWKIAGCPINGPAIALLLPAGRSIEAGARPVSSPETFAVAWFTGAHDSARVYAGFYGGPSGFGKHALVDAARPVGRPAVARIDQGRVLVAWLASNGTRTDLKVRQVSVSGALGPPVSVGRDVAPRSFPRLATSGGKMMLAWVTSGPQSRVHTALLRLHP
jgi:hypothetical protein